MSTATEGWSSLRAYPWVVCKSCGRDIGEEFGEYVELRRNGWGHSEALEEVGIRNLCCMMDIMRPGLIPQPPTRKDHEEQKAMLENIRKRQIKFGQLATILNPLSGLSDEAADAVKNIPDEGDEDFENLVSSIASSEDPDVPLLPEKEPASPSSRPATQTEDPTVSKKIERRALRRPGRRRK